MNYKGVKDKKWNCLNCGTEHSFRNYSDHAKYCNNKCQRERQTMICDDREFALFLQGKCKKRKYIFKFLIQRDGNKCSVCGITEWQSKPIRFWTDHIDGNATNNNPTNFRLICPNCDSQSDTFGAKNHGNGRKSRGLPTYG